MSARSEAWGDGSAQAAGTNLFKIMGGWGNSHGPGVFMIRVMIAGSTAATCMGITGGAIGSAFTGTASLPFLICASVGFALGAFRWYSTSIAQALLSLDAYPALMRLHLDANYPDKRFRLWRLERFRSESFRASWTLQSMLVAAWLTAQPALDEVLANEENAIIARERESAESVAVEGGKE